MSDSEDPIDIPDDGGDDLFGDDDDDAISQKENVLSDRELASDREDGEADARGREDDEGPQEFREQLVAEVPLYRHRIPRSKDGGLHSLRVPDFIKFNPMEYKADEWQPSRWELDNANSESPMPSVMFRRDPETGRMQSNANIYRWSDGSVTLAIGNEHFEIQSKPLAPPPNKPYNEVQDAHYYAAAAHLTTNSLLIVGHVTEQYTVRPNEELQDHALERLKAELAGAKKDRTSDMIIATNQDPELLKKQAEQAEKERAKAQRRKETAAARADGSSRYKGGLLSVGDLEGRRGAGGAGRKRGATGGPKKHRAPDYDTDDEPTGNRRANDYDMGDGFLVDSDESEEVEDDDEEEEDLLDDEDEEEEDEAPKRKRQRTAEPDEDAEGDEEAPVHTESKGRRRRVIADDEDDE
ncbi:Leo1-like protein-domain-containing protein [Chaetomium strumarium]|uniref:Leo1-like protein-domain-containing protein n=1 Tax=Chaetomium strumarium TaxID=1170767 RepID=A0AAJ0H1K0_9PEZI|nr:Leo1-like protein-domain-containing protein [Chaetomium strumarium]